jgi:hypothetical protein
VKLALVAGFLGFAILGASLGANPFGYSSLLLSLGFALGALIHWGAGLNLRRKDPYSLEALRRVQDEEERRAIEDELAEIDSAGNAVCLTCGTHFDPKLSLCPRCGRSIFH